MKPDKEQNTQDFFETHGDFDPEVEEWEEIEEEDYIPEDLYEDMEEIEEVDHKKINH